MIHGQGEKQEQVPNGAQREANTGRGRFDLLPFEALEAWAIWSEQGAVKYGDRNWEKGLLVSDCINRLLRHAIKAANGWTDEDHLAACLWNAGAAITMMRRRPDLNDHPWKGYSDSYLASDVKMTNVLVDEFQKYVLKQNPEEEREDDSLRLYVDKALRRRFLDDYLIIPEEDRHALLTLRINGCITENEFREAVAGIAAKNRVKAKGGAGRYASQDGAPTVSQAPARDGKGD